MPFKLKDGKIIETTTSEVEHDPQQLLQNLLAEKTTKQEGLNQYVQQVNEDLEKLEEKIQEIQHLLNLS